MITTIEVGELVRLCVRIGELESFKETVESILDDESYDNWDMVSHVRKELEKSDKALHNEIDAVIRRLNEIEEASSTAQ